jgi:hypothetical protein
MIRGIEIHHLNNMMAPNNSKRAIQRASNCTPNITEGLKTLRNRSEELENPNSNKERAL